jgi:dTDP-4-dehydrorhamnose reductase
MQILLTGGTGQVGSSLRQLAPSGWSIEAPSRVALNLSDPASIEHAIASKPWDAVINAAAFTAVDKAEAHVLDAWQANALGPAILAHATAAADIPLVHLSTDYVFSGKKAGYYVEDDEVGPINVYGASKEGGEQAVRTGNSRHIILRAAWLVSPFGNNFVKTMLALGAARPVLRVVNDQIGCPTSATDIASALKTIVERLVSNDGPWGTFHFVNSGEATWYEFARQVFARASKHGMRAPSVEPIFTTEYPTAARRPANSRLSAAGLGSDFDIHPRPWRLAIDEVVDALFVSTKKAGTE